MAVLSLAPLGWNLLQAGGVACVLRLTLAGQLYWSAIIAASTPLWACVLCGNREWSLRPQATPPAFGGDREDEFGRLSL